jgi:hypothetical protein
MNDRELTNLILQRTRPFIARVGKSPLQHWTRTGDTSGLVLALGNSRNDYIAEAMSEIRADAESFIIAAGDIKPKRIVSIGPGAGYAEAIICKHYGAESILLIDTEQGGKGHGFQENAAGYAFLRTAAERMPCEAFTWNPNKGTAPEYPFDLAISMLSLGFHFPASHYDRFLLSNANSGAILVHHCREPHGAINVRTLRP